MNSTDKDAYFQRVEEAWRRWSRLLFLSSRDAQLVEDLWDEGVPAEVVISVIEDGFTSVFKRKKKRMVSLWSLRRKMEREWEKRRTLEAGAGIKFKRKVEERFRRMLEEASALLEEGKFEEAVSLDERITELIWEEASDEERTQALSWAESKLEKLQAPQELKKDLAQRGALRRLREKKGIPFLF